MPSFVGLGMCVRDKLKSLPPEEGQQLGHRDLLVHMGEGQNFVYQIWAQQYSVPGFTYRGRSGKSTYYRLETFLLEGSQGNDLMDYSKEQVITDILDQYDRHLNFIHLHREPPGHIVMFPDERLFLHHTTPCLHMARESFNRCKKLVIYYILLSCRILNFLLYHFMTSYFIN